MEDLIREQLDQAGEACSVTPEVMKMDGCRLTSQSVVDEEVFLFKLFDTPCFPRGDLTTITGPAKSGKTFLVSMLMACCVKRRVLALERVREEPLKVVWLDTEQSRMTTKRILTERVGKMIATDYTDSTDDIGATEKVMATDNTDNTEKAESIESTDRETNTEKAESADKETNTERFPDEQYYVLNARGLTPKERVDMLELAIKTYEPDLVVIDGTADMMDDINSGPDSTTLIQQLLGLATMHKCNITTIIHLNRTGERLNLRGWIGTVLVQKSYEVLNCEKVMKTQTFSASLTFSRRYHLEQALYYVIDQEGLPQMTEEPERQPRDAQGKWTSKQQGETYHVAQEKVMTFCQKYIIHGDGDSWEWDLRLLFADAMGTRAMVGRDELKRLVMTMANIRAPRYYDKLFQMAMDQRVIQTTMDRSGRVVVIMA